MSKNKSDKPTSKHVLVAGEDGEIYRLDRESGNLVRLDEKDPLRRHARKLIESGVVTADAVPDEAPPDDTAACINKFCQNKTYHLINLASFKDPYTDDE